MSKQHFPYGGQAVIEGIMIRGQSQATVAVRQPAGTLAYKHFPLDKQQRTRWEELPFIRGIVLLWDTLNLGMRALNFSASAAAGEEEALSKGTSAAAVGLALVIAIGLFFVLPLVLASLASALGASLLLREVIEGVVRLGLIVGYIVAISRLAEVQRLFAYHGAEHKAVNAYEAGSPLTVAHVRAFSRIHPRCGTSFLGLVVLISFLVFLLFGGFPLWIRVISRVVLIPVIAAIAYEVLRWSAKNYQRAWVQTLVAPSLALQRLTTREPDDSMIATAIAALQTVLVADGVVPKRVATEDEQLMAVSM
jgi:uncharacterized protein YqhQ